MRKLGQFKSLNLKLPKPNLRFEAVKLSKEKFKASVESDVWAKALWLNLKESKAWFKDKFFDLIPRNPKTIDVLIRKDLSLQEFKDRLTLEAYPY